MIFLSIWRQFWEYVKLCIFFLFWSSYFTWIVSTQMWPRKVLFCICIKLYMVGIDREVWNNISFDIVIGNKIKIFIGQYIHYHFIYLFQTKFCSKGILKGLFDISFISISYIGRDIVVNFVSIWLIIYTFPFVQFFPRCIFSYKPIALQRHYTITKL